MNLIKERKPLSPFLKIKGRWPIFVTIGVVSFIYGNMLIGTCLIALIIVAGVIYDTYGEEYDGFELSSTDIKLSKVSMMGSMQSETIKFSKLRKLVYCKGGAKVPGTVQFTVGTKIYTLLCGYEDVLKLAPTFKYIQDNSVKMSFSPKDHEMELFMAGEVSTVPIIK